MKTYRIISTLILVISFLNIYSQNTLELTRNKEEGYFSKLSPEQTYTEVEGTPFFNEIWEKGIISFNDGMKYSVESFRYDIYANNLQFLKDDIVYKIPNINDVKSFSIGEFNFVTYVNDDKADFYEILFKNDMLLLLRKFDCEIIKGKESVGAFPATNDKFKINTTIYFKKDDASINKINLNKKNVLELMGDKKDEIEKFATTNNLKFGQEEDVIKIMEYYYSL